MTLKGSDRDTIVDEVRAVSALVAGEARHVRIDIEACADVIPAEPPPLDPKRHYLEGSLADVADYMLALDTINFGSGWFPTLRKRPSDDPTAPPLSGYFTVAWNFADYVRAHGPPCGDWLAQVTTSEIAAILDQDAGHELMSLYAQALRELGRFLNRYECGRRALDLVAEAKGSAVRLVEILATGMAMWRDRGFYKRAQIAASDLALAGVADFDDLNRLTIFADNLVPHVLRCDGVLVYDEALAACIDANERLALGGAEREIRACALHACALISQRTGTSEREIDNWLWMRGQAPEYKERPRHRCRCVFY